MRSWGKRRRSCFGTRSGDGGSGSASEVQPLENKYYIGVWAFASGALLGGGHPSWGQRKKKKRNRKEYVKQERERARERGERKPSRPNQQVPFLSTAPLDRPAANGTFQDRLRGRQTAAWTSTWAAAPPTMPPRQWHRPPYRCRCWRCYRAQGRGSVE